MRAPRLLILTMAVDWPAGARLAAALQEAGFGVLAGGPAGSFLAETRFVERCITFPDGVAFPVLAQMLIDLIERERLDLVIPADDFTLWLLHRLRRDLSRAHPAAAVTLVLNASLCAPERQEALELKSRLPEAAAATGLHMPAQIVEPDWVQAMDFAALQGAPVVVKLDRTWGGLGVRICADEAALEAALRFVPRELQSLGAPVRRVLQRYIPGETAVVVLAAWQGAVLAAFALRKLHCYPEATGPSSVVELMERPDLLDAVVRLARHFGLTGFADVEFRLEAGTGAAHLLEINPRIQPQCHLGRRFGADLCAQLFAAMTGAPAPPPVPIEDHRPVALFPNEWCRDPASRHLTESIHDVPWRDPGLLRRLLAYGEQLLAAGPG